MILLIANSYTDRHEYRGLMVRRWRRIAVTDAERDALVASVVLRVADYRQGQMPAVNAARVLAWVNQFDERDRPVVLSETNHLLHKTYLTRANAKAVLESFANNSSLAGENPAAFWRSVGFLRIQKTGGSQNDLLGVLDEVLTEKFNVNTHSPNTSNDTYIYLDDVLFSGNRIKNDIQAWATEHDIRRSTVYVLCVAAYTGGEWYAKSNLQNALAPRRVTVRFISPNKFESRRSEVKDASVMWLASIPEGDANVDRWKATLTRGDWFTARPIGGRGSTALFTSEESRHIVEQAFFKKGAYIYSLSGRPDQTMRPLGYSRLESPGFGATLITYRNCPNNAPLVLWWGDPNGQGPISQWTPLLPRHFGAGNQGAHAHGF